MKSSLYKVITFALLFLTMPILAAHTSEPQETYTKKITQLTKQLYSQKSETQQLKKRLYLSEKSNDNLLKRCDSLSTALDSLTANAFAKISIEQKNREELENKTKSHFNAVIVSLIILSVLVLIAFAFLLVIRMKIIVMHSNFSDKEGKWNDGMNLVKEHLVDFDNKFLRQLTESLETAQSKNDVEKGHTLALRVADEVSRMETNLSKMDSSIRGYKQLQKSIERIKNYYQVQGYDIVEMLGKPYNEGMLVNADFTIDEQLPEGAQIITSVKKPQVNYQGTMIQKATIIVSQNI